MAPKVIKERLEDDYIEENRYNGLKTSQLVTKLNLRVFLYQEIFRYFAAPIIVGIVFFILNKSFLPSQNDHYDQLKDVKESLEKLSDAQEELPNKISYLLTSVYLDIHSEPTGLGIDSQNDEKEMVKIIQIALKLLGYHNIRVDGICGEQTKRILEDYQKKKNIEVTKDIDRVTLLQLQHECKNQGYSNALLQDLDDAILFFSKTHLNQNQINLRRLMR